jgi:transposase
MTQRDRDRLVVLRKAQKRLITQAQAANELDVSERQIRRMLVKLRETGDKSVIHGLRGRKSNRKLSDETRRKAVRILSQEVYRGFGPTLASEYLAKKHKLHIGREALRQIMQQAGLWRSRRQQVETVHQWRTRRSARGELVQWDTSTHDWLEGRGERLYLIHMIDDATSELLGRFVHSDSTEENMRLLATYLERNGRALSFYTDKASLFHTTPKVRRDRKPLHNESEPAPPTQIGRALRELNIVWIAAHSPQAKGRVERSFATAQDRLVKGLRVAGARTLEQANHYLETEFLPWWNQHLVVAPASAVDAHRPLESGHDLAATLSTVETRQVNNDYTISVHGKLYQIGRTSITPGLRGATVRVEHRLDGTVHVRFRDRYLSITGVERRLKQPQVRTVPRQSSGKRPPPSQAMRESMRNLLKRPGPPLWRAMRGDRTVISDNPE